jgi:RimJ/RimL family protein N-acetyltransferase
MKEYYNQETERLNFRKMELSDLETWTRFFKNNDREHFLALDTDLTSEEKAKQWIDIQLERYQKNEFGHLVLTDKKTNSFVGICGLLTRNKDTNLDYEVAYSIMPDFWGNGFATEAAKKIKSFAKEHKLHKRVVSWIHPENTFSQNVARKNGLSFNGETIEFRGITVEVWEAPIT